jgi:ABC-type branched-subunit amino acid transport system permease subunit
VGRNPEAAASVGISVQRMRFLALALSGALAALGGIHMSMGYLTFFGGYMTANRGFIALATPYLGGGHPVGTGLASLIFGFFDALSIRIGTLQIPSQLPSLLPYMATVLALVIYALQNQLTVRVRTLRSAEGERFDAAFWKAIQRLSVLHMFLAMLAVMGIIISVAMFSAPDGFQGPDQAFPRGALIGLASLALIGINLPFITQVERIGKIPQRSGAASVITMWIYLGIFFMLLLLSIDEQPVGSSTLDLSNALIVVLGLILGAITGAAIWFVLGGRYLIANGREPHVPATA